jgi:hypothetical protein
LRVAFEDLARRERRLASQAGRRLPEDDEAFAVVVGTLATDAAVTPTGVSLNVMVDAIQSNLARGTNQSFAATTPVSGGVQATVAGAFGPERASQWRAGRRVRLPIQLHRPSRYLDPDVPDGARAGPTRTTLVGTVKSGALVELIAQGSWVDEASAAVRATSRRAWPGRRALESRSAAIVAAIVIGDRPGWTTTSNDGCRKPARIT